MINASLQSEGEPSSSVKKPSSLQELVGTSCNRHGPRVPGSERKACLEALVSDGFEAVLATGRFESCLVYAIHDIILAAAEPKHATPKKRARVEVPGHDAESDDDDALRRRGLRRVVYPETVWVAAYEIIAPIPTSLLHQEQCSNGTDGEPCRSPACVFCG